MSRARSNKRRREHENDEGATTDRIQEDCSGPHTISGGSHFLCWVCYSDELLGPRPALKKIRKLCREISEETDRRMCLRETKLEVRF
jgi:hypothetical protein